MALSPPALPLNPQNSRVVTAESLALGECLRRARETRGLTLEQVSRETKIPRRHLEALERGRLDELPPGTYRRGETIAFASAVGLDREIALTQLQRAFHSAQPVAAAGRSAAASRASPRRGRLIVAFVSAAAVAATVYWIRNSLSAIEPSSARPLDDGVRVEQPTSDAVRVSGETGPSTPPASIGKQPQVASAGLQDAIEHDRSAPPPQDSTLVVLSEPSGARVTMNGIGWGTTPLTLRNVDPGEIRIRVTKDGHTAAERMVRFTGRRMTVTVSLPAR